MADGMVVRVEEAAEAALVAEEIAHQVLPEPPEEVLPYKVRLSGIVLQDEVALGLMRPRQLQQEIMLSMAEVVVLVAQTP